MSLFSKLFHKDEKKTNNPNVIELPFGSFTFSGDDKDGVVVLFDENDKATVLEDSDYDRNFMSLIYPERNYEEA